jgi:predicted transcriptional regulator
VRDALLISLHPVHAERILAGTKTAELRRVRPRVHEGQDVLLCATAPSMVLLGAAVVAHIDEASPNELWNTVRGACGITRAEYDRYFKGAEQAAAIWLTGVVRFDEPITLPVMRARWPWLRIPQSYRFIRVEFAGTQRRIEQIAAPA